jgi:hypothetical protein
MSGMGPGGFGLPPAGYYVVPAQGPTYLVSTVDAFGQQRWSVGVPVQQPTPRFVAIQPQPQQQQYVKITGTPAQMEELRRAVASGRTIRFVEVPEPAIQPQPLQTVLAQEPSANEQVPAVVETSLCPPSHALLPMLADRQPAVTQELRGRELVVRERDRGPGPLVEGISDPESPRPTEQPTAMDLDFNLNDAANRLLYAGFGQIMGKFSLPQDFSIDRIKEVLPHIKHYADCADKVGDDSQRQNGRELLEAALTFIDPDVN